MIFPVLSRKQKAYSISLQEKHLPQERAGHACVASLAVVGPSSRGRADPSPDGVSAGG